MKRFFLEASDGHQVACYSWPSPSPKAAIQIAHGMGEHAERYDWVARCLNEKGYSVYASDHRGHGATTNEHLGYMGPDGWNRTLADMYELNRHFRSLHPNLEICLLGHSMGALLAQQYTTRHGRTIDAMVLSGSPGFKDQQFSFIGQWLLKFEVWRLEPWEQSKLMQRALFDRANSAFDDPDSTGYAWLSRDLSSVAKYVTDERCGFVLATGSLIDMFEGIPQAQSPWAIAKIPDDLPIYIFSGDDDPLHGERQDLDRMITAYQDRGISNIEHRFYSDGRHEMFNEINKESVMEDLIEWLERRWHPNKKGRNQTIFNRIRK